MTTKTLSPFHTFESVSVSFFGKQMKKISIKSNNNTPTSCTAHIFEYGDKDKNVSKNVSKNGRNGISYQSLVCLNQIGKRIKGQYLLYFGSK